MHQREPEFDPNLLVDDVKMSLKQGTPDLGEAMRERRVAHLLPECKILVIF